MTKLKTLLVQFAVCRRGATAIEYAVIAGGISVAIVGTVAATGASVENLWTTVKNAFG